jgi:hypothetical protein
VLECECTEYSDVTSSDEYSHVASGSCREGGQVDFIVSFGHLVPGFEYAFQITWTLWEANLTVVWKSIATAKADTYTLRKPLLQPETDIHFGMTVWDAYTKGNDHFFIDLMVSDMYPGLTTEEALIGTRNIDSSVNTFRLKCAEQKTVHFGKHNNMRSPEHRIKNDGDGNGKREVDISSQELLPDLILQHVPEETRQRLSKASVHRSCSFAKMREFFFERWKGMRDLSLLSRVVTFKCYGIEMLDDMRLRVADLDSQIRIQPDSALEVEKFWFENMVMEAEEVLMDDNAGWQQREPRFERCGGLGDRLQGLIQTFFEASTLGWSFTFDSSMFSDLLKATDAIVGPVHKQNNLRTLFQPSLHPDIPLESCKWGKYEYVDISTNKRADGVVGCAPHLTDLKSKFFASCYGRDLNHTEISGNGGGGEGARGQGDGGQSVIGCGWWYIFRLDVRLEKAVLDQLEQFGKWKQLFQREKHPVLAVHVRVGDVLSGFKSRFSKAGSSKARTGKASDTGLLSDAQAHLEHLAAPSSMAVVGHAGPPPVDAQDHLQHLAHAVLTCAIDTASLMGLDNATIIVISDSHTIKTQMQAASVKRVWSSTTHPVHAEFCAASEAREGSLVDLVLAALADALLKSRSSFSEVAGGIGMFPPHRVAHISSCGIDARFAGD